MSTLRITNIEAKADPSSPTVDEKIKLTNSNGDILVHIDGKTSGITTIGINTTAGNIKFDQNSNVVVTGIITATKFVGTIEPTNLTVSGDSTFSGDVGIGTDNPGNVLHLQKNGGDAILELQNSGNGNHSGIFFVRESSGGVDKGAANIHVESNTSGSGSALVFGTGNNISATGSERLRIDHNGNVGIGTENPLNGVDIVQSEGRLRVNKFSHLLMQNKNDSTTDYWAISARNGGELDIGYGTPDGNSLVTGDKLTITSAGQMGLGTVDPNSYGGSVKLAVANTSGTCGLSIVSATNGDGNLYYADGTSGDATYRGFIRYNHTTDQLRFGTAGAERMRILNTGGITFNGDTAAANALDDYEEGTIGWRLQRSNSIGSGSNNSDTSVRYTKIGNRVYVSGYLYTANTGSSTGVTVELRNNENTSQIATLPYVPNQAGGFSITGTRTIDDTYRNMAVTFRQNHAQVYIYKDDGDNDYLKNKNNVNISSSQTHLVIQFCGSYTTNS